MPQLKTLLEAKGDDARAMTIDEGETFVATLVIEKKEITKEMTGSEILEDLEGKPPFMAMRMMAGRLKAFAPEGMKFSVPVVLALSSLADRPGIVTLWAYALIKKTHELGKTMNMTDLGECFPEGLPTQEYAHACWDAQKCHVLGLKGDNYLDQREAYVF